MERITSKDNAKIKNFSKIVKDKKYRKEKGLFTLEGEKVLIEAINKGQKIDTLIMSEKFKNIEKYDLADTDVLVVPQYIFEKIADTKNPQGVIFSCFMPKNEISDDFFDKMKKIIILDNLQDPGNMGTIIRSASSFNIECIILLNNCVDHYSPKVVRSTMSTIFNLPIISMSVEQCFEKIKLPIYATCLASDSQNINDVDFLKCAVIFGNEANGVSQEVLKKADKKIIIPISHVESLNVSVASSIIMWEMNKI